MRKTNEIDRSLAIFYHPLFQEVVSAWTFALFCRRGVEEKEEEEEGDGYNYKRDFKMSFIEFIEFNMKVQKCLLEKFDLSNAFVSALNDWVKEITECFSYGDLYNSCEKEGVDIRLELLKCSYYSFFCVLLTCDFVFDSEVGESDVAVR